MMQHRLLHRRILSVVAVSSILLASCGSSGSESPAQQRARKHAAVVAGATLCDLADTQRSAGTVPGKTIGCVSLVARATRSKQLTIVGVTWSGTAPDSTGAIDDANSCGITTSSASGSHTRSNTQRGCMKHVVLSRSPQLTLKPAKLRSDSTVRRTSTGTYAFSLAGIRLPKGFGLTHGATMAASSGAAFRINSTAEGFQGIGVSFPGRELQPVGTFYKQQKLVNLAPGTLVALRVFVTPVT